ANTLFHFTRSIDILENILENNFYPRLCYENFFSVILNPPTDFIELEKAVPMVCFCDLPLSQVNKHADEKNYGQYALGLSKEWAIKNKVNPVLYTYKNSDISQKFRELLLNLNSHKKNAIKYTISKDDYYNQLLSIIQYIKPYEGINTKNNENTRYYDEREWRYIPRFTEDLSYPIMLRRGGEKEQNAFTEINEKIENIKELHLKFEPKDIKYIIVKSEDEILSMVDKVTKITGRGLSNTDIKILTTRIISFETIRENF
ncbi:MAG TPA: hypothetical protein ENH23_05535, partial [candidate division Zixibacteria bacterium]|nr:hypothetical protein [candidate division Zixibacteria bacterium]